jgi:hypothetical protein
MLQSDLEKREPVSPFWEPVALIWGPVTSIWGPIARIREPVRQFWEPVASCHLTTLPREPSEPQINVIDTVSDGVVPVHVQAFTCQRF